MNEISLDDVDFDSSYGSYWTVASATRPKKSNAERSNIAGNMGF